MINEIREKVSMYGYENTSLNEILTLIIGESASMNNLSSLSVNDLLLMSESDFKSIEGIGPRKAEILVATVALAKKLLQVNSNSNKLCIRSPEDMFNYPGLKTMALETQEVVKVFTLNTRNFITGEKVVFKGTLNTSLMHPREILLFALSKNAASVIVAHNHPSGDPTPTREDIEVTRRLFEAGKVIGIEVLDHIVVGDHRCISIKEMENMRCVI
ncbi:DNA repair protein RadC [Alkalihalobacillus oceani]|uniref:DNA repair protein RadC n=1 Tax=Halalkalibacter oceani TaxID=1653776 RepID=A0A9X2DW07_9BACI|nr:DNA repair protein RadC [Halalkalibacter oceani]MCM3716278.1 DNA repair protein RadC [Halalkalibacter oceani]